MSTPGESAAIRTLLVDDHALIRQGIAVIVGANPDIAIIGEAESGERAIALAAELRPDVICMDVEMPGMGGIAATRQIVAAGHARVLILTTFEREDYLEEALIAGASGFLLKNSPPERLAEGIRAVAAGDSLLSPEVTMAVIQRAVAGGAPLPGLAPGADVTADPAAPRSTPAPGPDPTPEVPLPPEVEHLTERELEVLRLLAQGLSNDEIASTLFVGRATVKTHVSNVLMKLALRDRVQAVAYAYRHGLVPLD
ncbi:response regulator [Serinibacter salmoneus]|uniref:LuxR family two component transcriptional regulator n=1 Tax=Serinibacter salmoneus TaxID=556530 RepID=A0A2A9CZB1_9MICO|nr:response regulator transcription factor [Serinibacter salmoneus]PFG19022.1 LuxR family two component transcriptional regulator [Serinibacter salmoneus]